MSHPPPPPQDLLSWRCSACWCLAGLSLLVVASFMTLDLQLERLLTSEALDRMGRFIGELMSPRLSLAFLQKVGAASLETLAMSGVGTLIAAAAGIVFTLPASLAKEQGAARWQWASQLLLNGLRSVPDLVWASILIIACGLGPLAGTLALALHTAGVLGRLFSEAVENSPSGVSQALRNQGVGPIKVFFYATLPTILPQLLSYSLYRWENNIRAAAILGVVGAGGLGQMLFFHMSLFQMRETSSILMAMILLVVLVDAASYGLRQSLSR